MFGNLTIRKQLILGFGFVILMSVLCAGISLIKLRGINGNLDGIVHDRWPKTVWANEMNGHINIAARAIRNMLLMDSSAEIQKELKRVEEGDAVISERLASLAQKVSTDEGKNLMAEVKTSHEAYLSDRTAVLNAIKQGDKGLAERLLFSKMRTSQTAYFGAIENLVKYQGKLIEEAGVSANAVVRNATIIVAVLTLINLLIAAGISVWIIGGISMPLNEALFISNKVAEGDLTVNPRLHAANEVGQLMSSMKNLVERQKKVIGDLKSMSHNVASASQQLSSSSEQMSRGVTEQSGRATQIATAANQMSQTVVDIARNSSNIACSATETAKVASDGEAIVAKSVEEVKAIADTVNESAKLIASLGDRSRHIGDIVNVIKDIADQTNLLALNAAIEAARAGDQGRGFAVVADEVRKLAERTAKATSEIGEMINAIQHEIDMAVKSMENGTERVETGVHFSSLAGEALGKIVASVKDLQSMVQHIAAATEEMSTASEQISGDIETIANISRETSSSSGEVSRASCDLARLATGLQDVAGLFKV